MKFSLNCILLVFLIVFVDTSVFGSGFNENNNGHLMLKLLRSRDSNVVHYVLNFNEDGSLNQQKPLTAYWVKHEDNHTVEPLTAVQKKYGYGLKFLNLGENKPARWPFYIAAFSGQVFVLKKKDNEFMVVADIDGIQLEVNSVFVQMIGNSYWKPEVPYVLLKGIDTLTGNDVVKTIHF